MDDRWLSLVEIASYLGVGKRTGNKRLQETPGHGVDRLRKFQTAIIDDPLRLGRIAA